MTIFFPNAQLTTCQFHLGQCLIRKLKQENIFNIYVRCPHIKKFVKALTALSFVEKEQLNNTFNLIQSSVNFPEILQPLYDYFFSVFISPSTAIYLPSLWNILDPFNEQVPKTNNAIKAWHNVFASTFGTSKFNLQLLISKLKDEEEVSYKNILEV
jgi:hypothetical protein